MREPQRFDIDEASAVGHAAVPRRSVRMRNAVVFALIALAWLAIDIISKQYFNAYEVGEHIAEPFAGIFQFTLVHNTGAAWGMFGDSTVALGVFSLIVCALLIAYLFLYDRRAHWASAIGVGLVVAGGVGNALDRFTLGYVVDFIDPVFIDFPVFNIADIGVTCGVIIVLIALFLSMRKEERGTCEQIDVSRRDVGR